VQVKITVAPPMQTFPWASLISAGAHRLPPDAHVKLPSAPFMVRVGYSEQGTPLQITVEY